MKDQKDNKGPEMRTPRALKAPHLQDYIKIIQNTPNTEIPKGKFSS
jgi:hypothetical protein